MESKLLQAAKEFESYCRRFTTIGTTPLADFQRAIREAEQAEAVKTKPILFGGGHVCPVCHEYVSNRGHICRPKESAPVAKPDVCMHNYWALDFRQYPVVKCTLCGKELNKPAPPRRTKLEIAVEAYDKGAMKNNHQCAYETSMRSALEAIKVNSQDEVEG